MCKCSHALDDDRSLSSPELTRRELLQGAGGVAASLTLMGSGASAARALGSDAPATKPFRVQPVLTYGLYGRQEATSWRSWGGLHTEADVKAESERIGKELAAMSARAGFPIEVLPIAAVRDAAQAEAVAQKAFDAVVIFAAGGWENLFRILSRPGRWNLMFLRHNPGPVYLWYEIAHPHFLRKAVDEYGEPGWSPDDIVVDSYDKLASRLRAVYGLSQTLGKRIVAIGGASGWGAGGGEAPNIARKVWKLDIVDFPYAELAKRIKAAQQDSTTLAASDARAAAYLRIPGTRVETQRDFYRNAFVLDSVFRDILREARTDALTVNACMGTIMPMSKTTACMPLSFLNDDGYLAFCESDFVVIPSGILLHYISGKPVFLNDPTFPHDGVITLAHCTAPRKMDGKRHEPVRVLTHFESDYGAAPKVAMRKGQVTTNLVPDFACKDWVGFAGTIIDNPFLDICRSQIDVRIHGGSDDLARKMKGFHWMLSYGDYRDEVGYALRKQSIGWTDISRSTS